MIVQQDLPLKINATHSHTKMVLAELRFWQSTLLSQVKETLSQKFGTATEYMKLKLIKKSGEEFPFSQYDEERKLKDLNVEDMDTIHVIDFNPKGFLVQNNIDDLSQVKKFEISEEDYNKRKDNVRKFKHKIMSDPNYKKMINDTKGPSFEAEAKNVHIGDRCLLGDGTRRGEVKYVGKVGDLGYGYFVGVLLDEPMGDCDGTYKGKKYFECNKNYGIFVRPTYIKCGDFPPVDEFNELEDEI